MHFSNKSMKEESFRVLAEELSYALLHASSHENCVTLFPLHFLWTLHESIV